MALISPSPASVTWDRLREERDWLFHSAVLFTSAIAALPFDFGIFETRHFFRETIKRKHRPPQMDRSCETSKRFLCCVVDHNSVKRNFAGKTAKTSSTDLKCQTIHNAVQTINSKWNWKLTILWSCTSDSRSTSNWTWKWWKRSLWIRKPLYVIRWSDCVHYQNISNLEQPAITFHRIVFIIICIVHWVQFCDKRIPRH